MSSKTLKQDTDITTVTVVKDIEARHRHRDNDDLGGLPIKDRHYDSNCVQDVEARDRINESDYRSQHESGSDTTR